MIKGRSYQELFDTMLITFASRVNQQFRRSPDFATTAPGPASNVRWVP